MIRKKNLTKKSFQKFSKNNYDGEISEPSSDDDSFIQSSHAASSTESTSEGEEQAIEEKRIRLGNKINTTIIIKF